ncbi:hypothetical protein [Ancylobacter sp.]|uniref:hypothetical protein n=1 Tax=Ancylobacter sp. TaxID=1872567 RepID=UPI003BA96EFA
MTADMPDPREVAREAMASYWSDRRDHDLAVLARRGEPYAHDLYDKFALLGARAMQDAMAGRVRVKELEWTRTERQHVNPFGGPPLPDVRMRSDALGGVYLVTLSNGAVYFNDTLIKGLRGIEGAQAHHDHRILSALEPAGAQEGAAQRHDAIAKEWLADPVINAAVHGATPAPDVPGLSARLRWHTDKEGGGFRLINPDGPEAVDALEALQAEVAAQKARADDMHRRAQRAEAPKMAARDVANKMWNFVWKAGERYHKARARATAAEAERDYLKAEVKRKDVALYQIANVGQGPTWYTAPSVVRKAEDIARAALAPAKAGG